MDHETFTVDDTQIPANAPLVPISWGELYDKITILEIKAERLTSPRQLANVRTELAVLKAHVGASCDEDLADLVADLREINGQLWELDEDIRAKEREKDFSEDFVAVARSIYQQNDRRAAMKHRINRRLASGLSEEKSYKAY